jgi:hypothetical protein
MTKKVRGKSPNGVCEMSKKQNVKKAGDSTKGYFEAGEVVTTQEIKRPLLSIEQKRVVGFSNGKPVLADKEPAVNINEEISESEKVVNGVDLHSKKSNKKKPVMKVPEEKKTFQLGTLVTSTMKKKDDPTSYWNTAKGIRRRIEMIQLNASGKMIKGVRSTEKTQNEAKVKIEQLKKQLKV